MNANELADKLDDIPVNDFESLDQHHYTRQAATMLRQQQAEIEALKAKTLTDEEIAEVFDNTFKVRDFDDAFLKFARAILRKAQEK
jgi:hypothetical protein